MRVRRTDEGELRVLAEFAAPLQARPRTHIVYLGTDVAGIAAELAEATWNDVSAVAFDGDDMVGWMVGDVDPDMGRVWWLGPFVQGGEWTQIADTLLAACRDQLADSITEEEMAVDARAEPYRRWATGAGFTAEEGSHVLTLDGPIEPPAMPVRELLSADQDTVSRLHEDVFPGTHTTGVQLVAGHDETHRRLVIEQDGRVVGYIAVEVQPDGGGYIDFLGVEPAARRQGLGCELVRAGVAELRRLGAGDIGLTVRAAGSGARDLYESLGFREERFVVPLRRGFSLA